MQYIMLEAMDNPVNQSAGSAFFFLSRSLVSSRRNQWMNEEMVAYLLCSLTFSLFSFEICLFQRMTFFRSGFCEINLHKEIFSEKMRRFSKKSIEIFLFLQMALEVISSLSTSAIVCDEQYDGTVLAEHRHLESIDIPNYPNEIIICQEQRRWK